MKLQDLMDTLAPPVHSNIGIPQQNNCYGAVREPLLQGKKELILASWRLQFLQFPALVANFVSLHLTFRNGCLLMGCVPSSSLDGAVFPFCGCTTYEPWCLC